MAKKVRRVTKARPRSQPVSLPTDRKATAAGESAPPATPSVSAEEQFRQEYAYVLKDLRWVFTLAGIMFALLIVLNLILR
jgi:hypothetical protein